MSDIIKRITSVAGEDFNSRDCRVTNPHITARESIELANYIVALEADLKAVLAERAEEARLYVADKAVLQAQLADAFGDGYYDGFIDGAKFHEETDCNTDPKYLGNEAMRCSEIAEGEKSKRVGIVSRQELAGTVEALTKELTTTKELAMRLAKQSGALAATLMQLKNFCANLASGNIPEFHKAEALRIALSCEDALIKQHLRDVRAEAIQKAAESLRFAPVDGGQRWAIRHSDLLEYSEHIRKGLV